MVSSILGPDGQVAPQAPGGVQMNVKPTELDDVRCDECNNFTFQTVMLMKRLPALISPTQKEAFMPMQVYACNSCGHVNKRFIDGMGGWFKDDASPQEDAPPQATAEIGAGVIEGSKLPGLQTVAPDGGEATEE